MKEIQLAPGEIRRLISGLEALERIQDNRIGSALDEMRRGDPEAFQRALDESSTRGEIIALNNRLQSLRRS